MESKNRWIVLAIVSSALSLIVIDMTVLYTALPSLTYDLELTASEKLWVLNTYSLLMAGLLPGLGTLGDRIGHKRLFMTGLIVFGIASLLAAYSPNALSLIGARGLLAIGAAMMMPATLSIIRLTFTNETERALAIGIWSAIAAGGAVLGPLIGGLLLEYFWWGSVFLINIPVVIIAFALTVYLVPTSQPNPDRHWDLMASVYILLGLLGITFAIKEVSQPDRTLIIGLLSFVVGAVFLTLFVRRQQQSPQPLIEFKLFRNPVFTLGVISALIATISLVGTELVISQRFQLVLGLTPLEAGLTLLPAALASFISAPFIGYLLPKIGSQRIIWVALTVATLGTGGYLLFYEGPLWQQVACLALLGVGIGSATTAASSAVMLSAPAKWAGMAASIEELSYELGGMLGIAIMGSLMNAIYSTTFFLPPSSGIPASAKDGIDEALMLAEDLPPKAAEYLVNLSSHAFDQACMVVLAAITFLLAIAAITALIITQRTSSNAAIHYSQ